MQRAEAGMFTINRASRPKQFFAYFGIFSKIKSAREAHCPLLMASGCLLMFSYYLLRPVREALFLNAFAAEFRSYAVGGLALVILILVQPYSRWLKANSLHRVFTTVLTAGILILMIFAGLGVAGVSVQLPFFIWLGLFSLLTIAQFWAAATRCVNSDSAKRVFPSIGVGLSLGAIAGSQVAATSFAPLGPYGLMLLAAPFLTLHLLIQSQVLHRLEGSRDPSPASQTPPVRAKPAGSFCGLPLIARSRYLAYIALLVMLLNCIDTTGDYILASTVQSHVLGQPEVADTGSRAALGSIFADYFFWSCTIGLGLQLLVVPRLFKKLGVGNALLLLPSVMLIGYSLVSFLPIFSLVYLVKIVETATNYAINGTARHALMVPLDPVSSCQGKTIIDTFFWRCGDLLHAILLYVGIHGLGFETVHFVILNVLLAAICLLLVSRIGGSYRVRSRFALESAGAERESFSMAEIGHESIARRSGNSGLANWPAVPQSGVSLDRSKPPSAVIAIRAGLLWQSARNGGNSASDYEVVKLGAATEVPFAGAGRSFTPVSSEARETAGCRAAGSDWDRDSSERFAPSVPSRPSRANRLPPRSLPGSGR